MIEKDFVNIDNFLSEGIVKWNSPSNIALVKYWGKKDNQIPQNPSISFTLSKSFTTTSVEFKPKKNKANSIGFEFDGIKDHEFGQKIKLFISDIEKYFSFLKNHDINIKSENNFPHSSGIASSASSMSALASCLVDIEKLNSNQQDDSYYLKKKSFIARLGSGSASRSIEGPVTIWGESKSYPGSSNLFAINISEDIDPIFQEYQNTILVIDPGVKKISSSIGHKLMNQNPFSKIRFSEAKKNIAKFKNVLKSGHLDEFINITESEALMIHSLMLSSSPYFILMKPNTLEIINTIWKYRNKTGSKVCFTLDAGANVHVLYPEEYKGKVNRFIKEELATFCQNGHYLQDQVGKGAKKV